MFQGFSEQTIDFLWGIRFNNDRAWFAQHKEEYHTHLLTPMKALADELYDFLREEFPDMGLICRVSRIYRDARRLHGRGPYKDHLWLSIERPTEDKCNEPCFWFEISPDGWSYGCGMFQPRPVTMQALRTQATAHPKELSALTRAIQTQQEFVLTGAEYKRPKAAPSELLAPWFAKKSMALSHDAPVQEVLFSRELLTQMQAGYGFLKPYYAYFLKVTVQGRIDGGIVDFT